MAATHAPLDLTPQEQAQLAAFRFDEPSFVNNAALLRDGAFPSERNQVREPLEIPRAGDWLPWPKAHSPEARRLATLGEQAMGRGEVGVVILNGGMATRFGGVVKGVVEVTRHHSFLALKLLDVARHGPQVPVFLLNSFATAKDTQRHLEEQQYFGLAPEQVHPLTQSISMRLTPGGELFRDAQGRPSFFAPGHGDLLAALAASSEFLAFKQRGGRYLAISNVDNLAATLSAEVIGAHITGQKPVTVEVAPRAPGDAGGAPVYRNGRLEVLEGFRMPNDFPQDALPVFNTNTFVFSVEAVRADYPLTWFRADKKVDGQPAVQFERLVGEITSFADATYLEVPRSGPEARFLPVKAPSDLPKIVSWVEAHLLGNHEHMAAHSIPPGPAARP